MISCSSVCAGGGDQAGSVMRGCGFRLLASSLASSVYAGMYACRCMPGMVSICANLQMPVIEPAHARLCGNAVCVRAMLHPFTMSAHG